MATSIGWQAASELLKDPIDDMARGQREVRCTHERCPHSDEILVVGTCHQQAYTLQLGSDGGTSCGFMDILGLSSC